MKFRHLLLVLPTVFFIGCKPVPIDPPENGIKTLEATSVTAISAVCKGFAPNPNSVLHTIYNNNRGICWGTENSPSALTIEGNHTSEGRGNGNFFSIISGLNESTIYYFRAYVENDKGEILYSNEIKQFETKAMPEGAIKGAFSINDSTQVMFSKGNLQYQASTGTWRFAENQYDYVGNDVYGNVMENGVKCDNTLISPDYNGWIDLFGWGTSGWNNGNVFYHPYDHYTDSIDGNHGFGYGPTNGSSYLFNLDGDYAQSDWGYNAISNGGNQTTGQWRTLTKNEWNYLYSREKSYISATVDGVYGAIIFPDYWVCPDGITFNNSYSYQNNVFTIAQWELLENAGAVFMPSAGYRDGTQISDLGDIDHAKGHYWLATYENEKNGSFHHIFPSGPTNTLLGGDCRSKGYSVRLVKAN